VTTIETPRSPYTRTPRRGVNWEKAGWIYMRVSGVILVVLILGHLFVNMMLGEGVKGIDFAFVAGKWASPFWQVWDVLMLWLALIHGANGMRTIVNDYATTRAMRGTLKTLIGVSVVATTFDPCPVVPTEQLELLPSFCETL
jgi:succinate dehydrogenase / fumarate reductase membrane anchor subunit